MPQPISWLPRLHLIARSVAQSVRWNYDRHDVETLFELQPRADQKLLEMLPTVQVGNSRLVDREVLAGFIDCVRAVEDTTKLFDQIRDEKAPVLRKTVRNLIRRDLNSTDLGSLPESVSLRCGRLEVSFHSV